MVSGQSRESKFLYEDDIKWLLHACDSTENNDLGNMILICLATGEKCKETQ